MNNVEKQRKINYSVIERRTNKGIVVPILYFMLELIIIGLILTLLYNISVILVSKTMTYILMGAFVIWSLYFIKESSIPRLIKVLNRTKL